jgi:hypothetical protein
MSKEPRAKSQDILQWIGKAKIFSLCCLLFVLCSLLVACEPDTTCYQELGASVQIIFSGDSVTATGDTVRYAQWDSLAVVGVGNNVGMQGNNVKGIGLELRPDTCLTMYLMLYHNQIDTLFIQHTPRQQFVSMACGCVVYHTITAAWSSDPRVDSVSIINAHVEAVAEDHLCIYLHE